MRFARRIQSFWAETRKAAVISLHSQGISSFLCQSLDKNAPLRYNDYRI